MAVCRIVMLVRGFIESWSPSKDSEASVPMQRVSTGGFEKLDSSTVRDGITEHILPGTAARFSRKLLKTK
jgi:hypothetical protein